MDQIEHILFTFEEKIIHRLMLQSAIIKRNGLLHGKLGIAIAFFEYGRCRNNAVFNDYAKELYDSLPDKIDDRVSLDFATGLCGFGWGIEYMAQRRFVDGNCNEICADIDQKIMERDIRRINDLSLETGLEGFLHYILIRLKGKHSFDGVYLKDVYGISTQLTQIGGIYADFVSYMDTGILNYEPDIYSFASSLELNIEEDILSAKYGLADGLAGQLIRILRAVSNFPPRHAEPVAEFPCFQWTDCVDPRGVAGDSTNAKDIAGRANNNVIAKKNVYIVDEYASSKTNGIGTYMRELIHCLKELKVNICYVAYCHDSETFKIEIKDGIRQMQFPLIHHFSINHHNVFDKFLRLYIPDSPDNVFLFSYSPCELLLKAVKSSFPLSKLLFAIHDMTWTSFMAGDTVELKSATGNPDMFGKNYPDLVPRFNEEKRMYETAHYIVALAQETVDLLQSVYKINSSKITVIPNGLQDTYPKLPGKDRYQLKEKLFIPLHEKVILFVGRVKHVKGIYQIINALKRVVKIYPDFRLVVVGHIFDAKNFMGHVGEIASKITFTGQISKDRLSEWYQIADIGLLCSYWEQCSYTGIEMMMYGLPVVASDGFCVGDMFINGKNAKVAHIGDRSRPKIFENNLTKAFLELLESPELRRTLGINGRSMYESNYQIESMKEGYQKFFDSL